MLPTDVTIRNWNSKASAWGFAPRTSCRLPIEHCALLVVNVPRLYEARRRGPIILAYCRAMGNGFEEKARKRREEAITGGWGERRTNPFNRESIYITDLPNNNSVSSTRWSRVIPCATSQSAEVAPSRRCLLPIFGAGIRRECERFRIFIPPAVDRICATSPVSALRGYLPFRRP